MAENEIKITIKGQDQASGAINNVTSSLSGMNKIIQSQVLVNVGQKLTQAFNSVKTEVIGLTTEYDNYVQQVNQVSRMTGTSTEEASRMIQVADDQRVSVEQLTQALKLAAQKGLTPNIEGLAKLADQYNALPNAAAKAQFAQDNFGRGWVNMSKMLEQGGQAIRDNAASIDQSLIIDAAKQKAAEDLFKAEDDLNDAFMGVRLELAQALIPAMVDLADIAKNTLVPAVKGLTDWFTSMPQDTQKAIISIGGTALALGALIGPGLQAAGAISQVAMLFAPGGLLAAAPAVAAGAAEGVAAIGAASAIALGPVVLLGAAVGLLIYTIINLGPQAWNTLSQLFGLYQYAWTGKMSLPGRASGGSVTAGHAYIVGENGPEHFIPKQNGVILPNGAGGGISLTVHFNGSVYGDRNRMVEELRPAFAQLAREYRLG